MDIEGFLGFRFEVEFFELCGVCGIGDIIFSDAIFLIDGGDIIVFFDAFFFEEDESNDGDTAIFFMEGSEDDGGFMFFILSGDEGYFFKVLAFIDVAD